uniref:Type I membrane protein n=1 Tax=uncultured crenarchaeote 74A4 TaxID=166279 RepID=Q977M3_9ARCH|nr:type I membrane protein [uncultured crenarchaeote 74A4]
MSWRKIVLCVIPLIILFSIIFIVSDGQNDKSEIRVIDKFKTNNHENMSYSELSLIAVQYDHKSLLRNIDNYSGKIIFVEGEVINLQREWIKLSDGLLLMVQKDNTSRINVTKIYWVFVLMSQLIFSPPLLVM